MYSLVSSTGTTRLGDTFISPLRKGYWTMRRESDYRNRSDNEGPTTHKVLPGCTRDRAAVIDSQSAECFAQRTAEKSIAASTGHARVENRSHPFRVFVHTVRRRRDRPS